MLVTQFIEFRLKQTQNALYTIRSWNATIHTNSCMMRHFKRNMKREIDSTFTFSFFTLYKIDYVSKAEYSTRLINNKSLQGNKIFGTRV